MSENSEVLESVDLVQNSPAVQAVYQLQRAYNHFNTKLFGGILVRPMLKWSRNRRHQGAFARDRWVSSLSDGNKIGEIQLNPQMVSQSPLIWSLSVLVHEMVHQWQFQVGEQRPSKPYHNYEWADQMEVLGLMPSSTDAPGGERTGKHIGHYIIDGGQYQLAYEELVASGFELDWYDVPIEKPKRAPQTKYVCVNCEYTLRGPKDKQIKCGDCGDGLDMITTTYDEEGAVKEEVIREGDHRQAELWNEEHRALDGNGYYDGDDIIPNH